MKAALVEITAEALLEALHLPKGTRIVDMRSTKFERAVGPAGPSLELIVESDGLPEVREGSSLERVSYSLKQTFHPTIEFERWNVWSKDGSD